MEKIKKSKNHFIDKLHKILDNRSPRELPPKDEKYLLSLKRRITSPFNNGFKKSDITDKTVQVDENDPLKPKVVIHPRERFFIEKKLEFIEKETPKPIEERKIPEDSIEISIEKEDLYEVEKTTIEGPEFIRVKPIDSSKEREDTLADEDLKEWESIEKTEKEFIESPIEFQETKREGITEPKKTPLKKKRIKKIEIQTSFCPKCGSKLSGEGSFCGACGQKLISDIEEIKEEEPKKEIIELEPIEIEKPEEKEEVTTWEPIEEGVDTTEIKKDTEQKIQVFKDLTSIDPQTAIILYDNGITDIQTLKNTPTKNLTKIKDLKRKTIKQIQKELKKQEKTKSRKKIEEELVPTWEPVEIQKQDTVKTEEEVVSTWEPIEEKPKTKPKKKKVKKQKKTKKQETEPKEEFLNIEDVEEVILFEEKEREDVFVDIESIDEKISNLLIKNKIDTLEKLEETTIKDLTKIKGIRKKIAKQIKREVKEHIEKKILKELTSEGEKKIQRKAADEEEHDDEWEHYDEGKVSEEKLEKIKGFRHKDYTLFEKTIKIPSGRIRTVRFFSKAQPEDSKTINLPKGYEVKVNKKTGVPYLKKKK
jgi:hypothetical protein